MSGVDRRRVLAGAGLLGAGLVVGFRSTAEPIEGRVLNNWVRLAPDGKVTLFVNTPEIGQGANVSLARLLAEELEVDWEQVRLEPAPVEPAYYNPMWGAYAVYGSGGVRGQFKALRTAGAAARIMLVEAAAARWRAPAAECVAEHGQVRHTSGRSAAYGDLVLDAALRKPPLAPPLKPRSAWRLIGRSVARPDLPAKVDGSAVYGIDVQRPGLTTAAIIQCPVYGGRLAAVDPAAALAVKGVRCVVNLDDAVAVVATGYWPAQKAADALTPSWDIPAELRTTQNARQLMDEEGLAWAPPRTSRSDRPKVTAQLADAASAALASAPARHSAIYETPFLAHAPLEPMNATAEVSAERAELWVATQTPSDTRKAVARALGLAEDRVVIHPQLCGGGFGRRIEFDFAVQAALIARQAGAPVKLVWSRQQDIARGFFRPAATARLESGLDSSGYPLGLRFATACGSPAADSQPGVAAPLAPDAFDDSSTESIHDSPYAFGAVHATWRRTRPSVRIGYLRGVGSTQNTFFLESFLDELAHRARVSPLDYRRRLLKERPRELAVLDTLAVMARLDRPAPAGRGRGLGFVALNGSVVAQAAEVSVSAGRMVKVHRVWCAADCGVAVNPDAVRAQMEGGIIFGLTAAALGEITLDQGAVQQSNFHDYPLLTLAQTPAIEIVLVGSEGVGGAGEEGVPPIAPAVCNAIFNLTGERLRSLPLSQHGYTLV